jgi:two-component system, response regulator
MLEGRPISILLVEDDLAHAAMVQRGLEDFQVANRVTLVTDGQQALDQLRPGGPDASAHRRPDLILLDLRLPKVDGHEVLRRIKTDESLRSIPTIVLTTSSAEADLIGAYEQGADSYLVKPVGHDEFAGLMEAFGYYWLACNRYPG